LLYHHVGRPESAPLDVSPERAAIISKVGHPCVDGIGPQMIEVVGVLVAAADREHIDKAVHDRHRPSLREAVGA
jgi:hypothetical protein